MWEILGIDPTTDEGAIRKAYARALKNTRPDKDPQGYQQLREAFDEARRYAALNVEDESDMSVNITFSYVEKEESARTFREPDGLPPHTDFAPEPLWSHDALRRDAQRLAQALMQNEFQALQEIERYLDHELPDALEARSAFSLALAEALSEQNGLGPSLVNNVSALMGWELESFHAPQLPGWIVEALEAQVATTYAEHHWQTLALQARQGRFARLKWRVLTAEDGALPWWARLVPDLMMQLKQEVMTLRWRYPQLLDRVNPALLADSGPTLAVSWTLLIGLWFWGYSAWIAGQESLTMAAQSLLFVAVAAFYFGGYPRIRERAEDGGKIAKIVLVALLPLSLAIIAMPLFGVLKLAYHVQPIEKGPARVCMAIAIMAYPVYWVMKMQGDSWWVRPGNGVRNLLLLPVRLIREQNIIIKFLGLFFTPILMALIIQMTYYVS